MSNKNNLMKQKEQLNNFQQTKWLQQVFTESIQKKCIQRSFGNQLIADQDSKHILSKCCLKNLVQCQVNDVHLQEIQRNFPAVKIFIPANEQKDYSQVFSFQPFINEPSILPPQQSPQKSILEKIQQQGGLESILHDLDKMLSLNEQHQLRSIQKEYDHMQFEDFNSAQTPFHKQIKNYPESLDNHCLINFDCQQQFYKGQEQQDSFQNKSENQSKKAYNEELQISAEQSKSPFDTFHQPGPQIFPQNLSNDIKSESFSSNRFNDQALSDQIVAELYSIQSGLYVKKGNQSQEISDQSDFIELNNSFIVKQELLMDDGENIGKTLRIRSPQDNYSYEIAMVQENIEVDLEKELNKIQDNFIQKLSDSCVLETYFEDIKAVQVLQKADQIMDMVGQNQQKLDQRDLDSKDKPKIIMQIIVQIIMQILWNGYSSDTQKCTVDLVFKQHFLSIYSESNITKQIEKSLQLELQNVPQIDYSDVKDLMKLGEFYFGIKQFLTSTKCYLKAIQVANFFYWHYDDQIKSNLLKKAHFNIRNILKITQQKSPPQNKLCLQAIQVSEDCQTRCQRILLDKMEEIQNQELQNTQKDMQKNLIQTIEALFNDSIQEQSNSSINKSQNQSPTE